MVRFSRRLNVWQSLSNKFILGQALEINTTIFSMDKVLIVGGITKHTSSDDEFWIISIWMPLWQ